MRQLLDTESWPIERVAREFEAAWADFARQIEASKARSVAEGGKYTPDWYAKIWAKDEWPVLMWYGEGLVDHILKEKAIPPGKAKPLELAARQFVFGKKRMPLKPVGWAEKNLKHVGMLLDATKTWKGRVEEDETGGPIQVGGFHVIDTLHLDENKIQITKKNLEDVQAKLRRSGIPQAVNILYGNVYLVGKIRGNAAAWYKIDTDELLVRPTMRKYSDKQTHFVLHELGHRYWNKMLAADKQKAWRDHHWAVEHGEPAGVKIEPGVIFKDVRITGIKGDPVVDHVDDRYVYFVGSDAKLDRMRAWNVLYKQNKRDLFPTSYASTDPVEHFCEAFAMYTLGSLPENHRRAFDEIVVGKARRVAERYMNATYGQDAPSLNFKYVPNFDGVLPDIFSQLQKKFDALPDDDKPLGNMPGLAMSGLMVEGKPLVILVRSYPVEDSTSSIVSTGIAEINGSQGITIDLNGKFSVQGWRNILKYNKKFHERFRQTIFKEVYNFPQASALAKHYLQQIEG